MSRAGAAHTDSGDRVAVVVDVIVVGMGAAGCATAVAAHDAGADVLILEKSGADEAGGNSRVSGGAWFGHDDPEGIATYLRALCGDRLLPEAIVETWAHGTREISDWMSSLGLTVVPLRHFPVEYPELPGSDAYDHLRCVDGAMGDFRLYRALQQVVGERDITVRYDCAATGLLTDPVDGRVTGVVTADGERVHARGGVVLTTGGFEGDAELVREHLGLEQPPLWGSAAATGDGLRMATSVGADLWHMDNMMAVNGIPRPDSRHGVFAMPIHRRGYLWVDDDGRRFVDECVPTGHGQALIDGEYRLHPHRPMHVVFDERTRVAGPIGAVPELLPVGWSLLVDGYRWSADNSAEIDAGWIHRADTLEELAALTGVPAPALVDSVTEYNRACEVGHDGRFGRAPETLVPVSEPPFYAYRSGPMLGWTSGGPRRDEHSRVVRPSGEVIEGLYAAGSVSSTYSWAKDGGFHIADALVFGRIAGEHAASQG
ncbi:FAD-dependent oxidoreductase [Microbacter sp. ANSKLAB05]|nr:FAD-dependent oxidoreductase [Microbacter sp. ANSKLAB05]